MNKTINTIGIVGLGLIGTSLGMAIKSKRPNIHIKGLTKTRASGIIAKNKHAIDELVSTLDALVDGCDLIVLATPIQTTIQLFPMLTHIITRPIIITDTASTKQLVCGSSRCLPQTVTFIGGHPMAGKESSGPASADKQLFVNRPWILTPEKHTQTSHLQLLQEVIRQTGANPHILTAKTHDQIVASISHIPFILSTLLMETAMQHDRWNQAKTLASSGFTDTTRLSGGNPSMHTQIIQTNTQNIIIGLTNIERNIRLLKKQIQSHTWKDIENRLQTIQHCHTQWKRRAL